MFRIDKFQLDGFARDESTGFLILTARPTRAGVFKYINPDGSVTRELRHPDDVFNSDSMNSLRGKPLTDLHPFNGKKVNVYNAKGLMVGMVTGEIIRTDDDYLETKITVIDAETIRKIADGDQPELSCGYDTKTIKESGDYNGERYDVRQKKIVYNHVAAVPKGRAGEKARFYTDSADDAVTLDFEIKLDEEEHMTTKTLLALSVAAATVGSFKADAINFEIDKELQPTILPLMSRIDDITYHAIELQKKLDAAQGTIDELKTKADTKMSAEDMNKLASERADVLGVAGHIGLKDFEKLDNNEIKKAVVLKKNDGINLDEKSEAYVEARFDSITEQIKSDTKGFESLALLKAVTEPDTSQRKDNKDGHEDEDELSPRDQYRKDTKDLYKETLKQTA